MSGHEQVPQRGFGWGGGRGAQDCPLLGTAPLLQPHAARGSWPRRGPGAGARGLPGWKGRVERPGFGGCHGRAGSKSHSQPLQGAAGRRAGRGPGEGLQETGKLPGKVHASATGGVSGGDLELWAQCGWGPAFGFQLLATDAWGWISFLEDITVWDGKWVPRSQRQKLPRASWEQRVLKRRKPSCSRADLRLVVPQPPLQDGDTPAFPMAASPVRAAHLLSHAWALSLPSGHLHAHGSLSALPLDVGPAPWDLQGQ